MNKRIQKVREDIRLTENRIREMNEYLKTLRAKEKQLCDDEILKTMRDMAGKGGDVMALLQQLQGGIQQTEPVEDTRKAQAKTAAVIAEREENQDED